MQEIEKKYLIKKLPNLENIPFKTIKQGYLNTKGEPTLRIRQIDNEYFLTYKFTEKEKKNKDINICNEYELPITKKAFNHLQTKIDGIMIEKQRYNINIGKYTAELDVFTGKLEGLIIVETEFPSLEEANNFIKPDWFGDDVTNDKKYRNSYLATNIEK